MRFAALLLAFGLIGCDVPNVAFYDAAASDGTDARPGLDAAPDIDASETDAGADGDAASDGPAGDGFPGYCMDSEGGIAPTGFLCCPGGRGEACSGACMLKACQACGDCSWPSICCTTGANGVCKPSC